MQTRTLMVFTARRNTHKRGICSNNLSDYLCVCLPFYCFKKTELTKLLWGKQEKSLESDGEKPMGLSVEVIAVVPRLQNVQYGWGNVRKL